MQHICLAAQKLEYRSARHEVRPVGIRYEQKNFLRYDNRGCTTQLQ